MSSSPRVAVALAAHQHHRHLPAFHARLLLHLRDVGHRLRNAVEHGAPQLRVRDRAPAEEHGHLHPVAIPEEITDVTDLEVDVVPAGLRPELHFLELAGGILLARLLRLLLLGVLVLAVVHDPAHRRVGGGRDLDQVELLAVGDALGIRGRHHTELLPVAVADTDLTGTDLLVDAGAVFALRYDAPPGMRASARVRATKASSASAPRFSPPMRGATVPSAASRSPTTARTGIFSSCASRILKLSFSLRKSASARRPASRHAWTTRRAYASAFSLTGSTSTCTGASQRGSFPAVCSSRMAMKRSREPSTARWIMTGSASLPSEVTYFSSKRPG